jgi:hypothetical protein
MENLDRAVGIATGYGLDGPKAGVRVPVGARILSSPCSPDTFSGSRPASYPVGTGRPSLGSKAVGA